MNEIIPYNKGYRINKKGKAFGPAGNKKALNTSPNGYLKFTISVGKTTKAVYVHRLQAYQKFGDKLSKKGIQVRHLDGNCKNNEYDNIDIGTASDNMMDIPQEVRVKKAKNANLKYPHEEIYQYYTSNNCTYKDIMNKFGISSKGAVSYIINKFK